MMTDVGRWSMRAAIAVLVALALGACGRPAGPAAEGLRVVDVLATSQTSILVTFNMPVSESAEVTTNYRVTNGSGASLEVVGAVRNPSHTTVLLATEQQDAVTYDVTIENIEAQGAGHTIRSASSAFSGSSERAPFVAYAIALSNTEILLTFANPPPGSGAQVSDSALNPAYYDIVEPDPKYAATPDLEIVGIRWADAGVDGNADQSMVIIETAPQQHTLYEIRVTNVVTRAGDKLIDPGLNRATFNGIPADDDTSPRVTSAVATSNTTVLVSFSEPVTRDANDARHYTIVAADGSNLGVISATLKTFATQVELTTEPMRDELITYTVTVASAVQDLAGNPMDPDANSTTFQGISRFGPIDGDVTPPRVSNVGALGNTSVVVTFNEPVQTAGAENPAHYRIVGANEAITRDEIGTLRATLTVLDATLDASRTAVVLTTMAMSDIEYVIAVTNVQDLAGNQIAPPELGVPYPSALRFFGIPASGQMIDSDCDDVPDAVELRGWVVSVVTVDGRTETREVTSDPGDPRLSCVENVAAHDTNQDGLDDYQKWLYRLDPRSADTDGDDLSDDDELNVYYTDPLNQDTDGDGLTDGLEVTFFGTSPLLADTDGDGFPDFDEVMLQNRNPLVADLPIFDIQVVGDVQLGLDVRYTAESSFGGRFLEQRSSTANLSTSDGITTTRSNESASEWFINAGVNLMVGYDDGFKYEVGGQVEGGYKESTSATFTNESVRQTQREQATSMTSDRELTDGETLTREVVGASMAIALDIVNRNDIAFTISNIEITAKIRDPSDPTRFVAVATLVGNSGSVSVGPAPASHGPLRFTAIDVTPSLIEELRIDPRGIIFEVVNYDITDEFGRNLAFTSQDVNDRTATLMIDYNGFLPFEPLRVATYSGFDSSGRAAGIRLGDAFETIVGLAHVSSADDAEYEACLTTLNARGVDTCTSAQRQVIDSSYSTRTIDGREELWRVRSVVANEADRLAWFVFVPRGTIRNDFRDIQLTSGQVFQLIFAQDLDGDGLTSRDEALFGSVDSTLDVLDNACFGTTPFPADECRQASGDGTPDSRSSDLTGLEDNEQVYGRFRYTPDTEIGRLERGNPNAYEPWLVVVQGRDAYRTSSNPARADTDGDGLTDCQELGRCDIDVYLFHPDARPGDAPLAYAWTAPGTLSIPGGNPAGVLLAYDALGRVYGNLVPGLWRGANGLGLPAKHPTIDPLHTVQLSAGGFQPTITDPRRADTDGDGLSDFHEIVGFAYDAMDAPSALPRLVLPPFVNATGATHDFATNPLSRDTDGDGLADGDEVRIGTDPRRDDGDLARDNDGDGLTNFQETQGWNIAFVSTAGDLVLCKPNAYTVAHADCRIVPPDQVLAPGEHVRSVTDAANERRWRFVPGPSDPLTPPSSSQALATFTADDLADRLGVAFGSLSGYLRDGQQLPNTTSDPNRFDTSGNGLSDYHEYELGTHPRLFDTDGDGLSDFEEVSGQAFPPDRVNPIRFTDPLNADTDRDEATDYQELRVPWVVQVVGQAPYSVHSDPTDPDADRDGLLDGAERDAVIDPNAWDTDGDGVTDYNEVMRPVGGVTSNPLRPDQILGFRYTNVTILGGCPIPTGEDGGVINVVQWFGGILKIELPDGTVSNRALLSEANGQSEGTTVALTNAVRYLALGQDQTLRAFSGPVTAGYAFGGEIVTTNRLGDFAQSYDYPANGGLYNVKLSGPYEDPENNTAACELSVSWLIERVR